MYELTSKQIISIVLALWLLSLPFVFWNQSQPAKSATFIIAYWDYPSDDYGQGITFIEVHQNSTGSWLPVRYLYDDLSPNQTLDVPIGCAFKLMVRAWLNSTLTGATGLADGQNYQRHRVVVTTPYDSSVFSQENFTYSSGSLYGGISSEIWMYDYTVILDFISIASTVYTVVVTYEVYYPEV